MTRKEFSMKVRQEAFARSKNMCELCGAVLPAGITKYEFDHIIPYFLTQDSSAGNCQVVCIPCHRGVGAKTADDATVIAKVKRIEAKHNGTWPESKYKLRSRGFQKRGA
jgi:5-methylcytosine-specific restriction endonuclease McrA